MTTRGRLAFLLAFLGPFAAAPACSATPPSIVTPDAAPVGTVEPDPVDPGPVDAGADRGAGHNLDALTIVGKVNASGVGILARCGQKPAVRATSDVNGNYRLTADVKGCNPLVLEYERESFLPNLRVVHLPPPASPLVLNVPLGDLVRVECGTQTCRSLGGSWTAPIGALGTGRRGWYATASGLASTDLLAGEMRDTNGQPIVLFGFSYTDLYDADGNAVAQIPKNPYLIPIATEQERINIGDVKRATADKVEMSWYRLDKSVGRWVIQSDDAQLFYKWPCDVDPPPPAARTKFVPAVEPGQTAATWINATQAELADIRAGTLMATCGTSPPTPAPISEFGVVGPMDRTGWYAWGISIPKKSCFAVTTKDSCGKAVAGATVVGRGRFQPYRTELWTNAQGKACIESLRSESPCIGNALDASPDDCDYNYNRLGGELFWLNVDVAHAEMGPPRNFENQEISRADMSCDRPESCIQLQHTFEVSCP